MPRLSVCILIHFDLRSWLMSLIWSEKRRRQPIFHDLVIHTVTVLRGWIFHSFNFRFWKFTSEFRKLNTVVSDGQNHLIIYIEKTQPRGSKKVCFSGTHALRPPPRFDPPWSRLRWIPVVWVRRFGERSGSILWLSFLYVSSRHIRPRPKGPSVIYPCVQSLSI